MNEEHEFEHATGDSVVVLPLASESDDELTLLVLPSRISEDKLGINKENNFFLSAFDTACNTFNKSLDIWTNVIHIY